LKDDPDAPKFLETVVGKGYRLIGEIDLEPAPPEASEKPSQSTVQVPHLRWRGRPAVVASAVLVVLLIVAAKWGSFLPRQSSSVQHAPIHSIVILPLANLSGDPAQEYFVDGMTDELITEIAQVSSLRVISRTSAMHNKATAKTAPEIAKQLNVDSVLEGAVSRSGGRVRITAQLIEARADEHLWANSYEGESKDVLEMQDTVARDVVKQIRLNLTTHEQERLSRPRPVNPEAHDAYLKGLFYWNKRDRAGLEKAIGYFNHAIVIDPNYALPYSGIAQSYIPLTYLGYVRGNDVRAKVASAVTKALELDDSLAEAHTALGSAKHFYEYDWAGAE